MSHIHSRPCRKEFATESPRRICVWKRCSTAAGHLRVQLFGSGSILNEALHAPEILQERFNVQADVWSVTSYKLLHQDALDTERWNRFIHSSPTRALHHADASDATGGKSDSIVVAASDYMKVLPDSIARWIPGRWFLLVQTDMGAAMGVKSFLSFFSKSMRITSRLPPFTH